MNFRGILLGIFPPPRRRITSWSASPLILFLVIYLGACAVLELTGVILFSKLLPFALLVVTPWLWWMHAAGYSRLNPRRSLVALFSRFFLFGLLIVLLTEPRAVRKHDALSIVFAVDTSASIKPEKVEQAIQYIVDAVADKPQIDEAGLVFFGKDAAVELPPNISFPYEAINVQINKDGTDIAQALSLAAAMLPQEHQGRIVLITDGIETTGNLNSVLDALKAADVAVDVLPIQYNYEDEVWLERLQLPRFVKSGETYEAAVLLSSLQKGTGRLTLQENGHVIFDDTVEFDAGKTRIALPIYLRQPGYYEYTAHIDVPRDKDNWTRNNRAISYLYLKGKGKILVVTDPEGNELDWAPLIRALIEAERDVEQISAYALPREHLALLPYDCIIFPNIAADAFDQQQLQTLHDAVYNQGTGFLMIGGKNSFGPGGYHRTPIEQLLPVSMDISQKKVLPKGAMVIVLHTCEFEQGNTWAKRITKQAINVLDDRDEVGVVVYDWQGADKWLFPLTPAGEYTRLARLINNAQIGDMPSFEPTMKMGLAGLQASDAATKHMIIISDGDPSPPPPKLIDQFIASKISVSMVAINPHGGQDISKMQSISNVTGGRYHFPSDPSQLPSIFIKEAKTLRRSAIQNRTFVPTVSFRSPILKGFDALPPLHGYVLTTPKPRSKTILEGPEEDDLDPVLATWRYGLGATAAITSDLSPNWGADWVQWEHYRAFVKQLIIDISRVSKKGSLRTRSFPVAGQGLILIEDYAPQEAFLQVQAQVDGPDNLSQAITLEQVGPRRYEGRFPLSGEGRYQVRAVGVGEGREEHAHGGFVVPYSREYLRFRSNKILLDQTLAKTGGRELNGNETGEQLYSPRRQPKESSKPIVDWLLILLACLVPMDVALRRVQLDLEVIRGWFGLGRSAPLSDETFSALLARKHDVAATLQQPEPQVAPPLSLKRTTKPDSYPATTTRTAPASPQPEAVDQTLSTTERLLAAKRRAQPSKEGSDDDQTS